MEPITFLHQGRCAAGRSTLLRDAGHDIFRPAGLAEWTLNLTVAGVGRVRHQHRQLPVQAGDLLLIRPGVPNDYGREPRQHNWVHQWVIFEPVPTWYRWLSWPEWSPGIMRLGPVASPLLQTITELLCGIAMAVQGPHHQRDEIAMGLLQAVLGWCDTINPATGDQCLDPRIKRAADHICRHYAAPIPIAELAVIADLSPSRFSHLFRDQLGVAPLRFQQQVRLDQACNLLLMSGDSIACIAAQVGLEDPVYFTRLFRRRYGCSPRAWRQRGHSKASP